jgi:hypothetical protein
MRHALRLAAALAALLAGAHAHATTSIPVPEPGVLELLAAGVAAGAIVWARNRRK